MTTSGEPSSSSEEIVTPVSRFPPKSSKFDSIARVIATDPPSATGQP
jgi:hypothetical protein